MHTRALSVVSIALAAMLAGATAHAGTLKVCADPDYLPFSDRAGQGFENAVAQAVARYLGDSVEYTWGSYRADGKFEEFLANTLNAHRCDVVMDLPYGSGEAFTTHPYYVSSYVFVFSRSKRYDLSSMDSPILREVKVGFEEDTPPETGLKLRGLVERAVAFDVGEHDKESPRRMLDAVRSGEVDVMITWEPAVGSFLPDYPDLKVVPIPNERTLGSPERYSFPMSMAVRFDDRDLADRIDAVIRDHGDEIKEILKHHGVALYRPGGELGGAGEM